MVVDFIELKKIVEEGVSAIYLFEGEDAYFGVRGLTFLKNRLVSEPSLNFAEFDGKENAYTEISASMSLYPFLSEYRLTAVNEFYPNKGEIESLQKWLKSGVKDSILVVINQRSDVNLKKLDGITVINCSKWESAKIARWIWEECKKLEVGISETAIFALCNYCACEMFRIENELNKLACFVGKGEIITDKAVDELVWKDNEHKIYELTDCLCKKDTVGALNIVKDMLSRGETEQRLLISLYNHFRKLLHLLVSDMTNEELSSSFGVKEYAIKKMKEQAKRFKVRTLKKAVDRLTEVDYGIKRGAYVVDSYFWVSLFQIIVEG